MAEVLDDGAACEDHIVLVDTSKTKDTNDLAWIIAHEMMHAAVRFKTRRK